MPATDLGAILALPAPAQPPVQYSWWVWALGLFLLALIAAWYVWLIRTTRPKAPEDAPGHLDAVRAEHLALVDEAEARFTSGGADLRDLHLDLNFAVRSFATARTGIDTASLTVSEFTRLPRGSALAVVLADYSEPAFAAVSDAQAHAACDEAREVIRAW